MASFVLYFTITMLAFFKQLKKSGENGSSQNMLEETTSKEVRISFMLPNDSPKGKLDLRDIPETTITDAD